MTDKKILEEVYRRVVTLARNGDGNVPSQERFKEFKDFIEREWRRQDEGELEIWRNDMFDLADDGQMYNADPCTTDVKVIERHRGLEIGEDGTVTGLK
jgi:hypothetical protein